MYELMIGKLLITEISIHKLEFLSFIGKSTLVPLIFLMTPEHCYFFIKQCTRYMHYKSCQINTRMYVDIMPLVDLQKELINRSHVKIMYIFHRQSLQELTPFQYYDFIFAIISYARYKLYQVKPLNYCCTIIIVWKIFTSRTFKIVFIHSLVTVSAYECHCDCFLRIVSYVDQIKK